MLSLASLAMKMLTLAFPHTLTCSLAADPGGSSGSKATMSAQMFYPIDVIAEMTPQSLNEPSPGVFVLDFGQNFQGVVRLTLPAPVPGNLSIRVRHAELLNHPPYGPVDGNLYVGNLRSAAATDYYTTRTTDSGFLILEPMFTVRIHDTATFGTFTRLVRPIIFLTQFHGFRFVEITGLPTPPTLATVTGLFLRSALPLIGNTAFPSSAKYLNSIQHAVEWGIGSNLNGVISDCCQRDERKVLWGMSRTCHCFQ